jgi:toxin FitB
MDHLVNLTAFVRVVENGGFTAAARHLKSLAPGGPKGATRRSWIETHEDPLFLSAASLVELKAAIDKVRGRDTKRAEALQAWLDGLITTFSDRIRPIDIHVAVRAGRLLPYRQEGLIRAIASST